MFKNYEQIEQVILYGSRAKGNHRPGSDIDLTLLGNIETADLFKIETALDDLLLVYKIDVSIFQTIENEDLLEHIQRVGIEFYSKS